MKKLQSVLLLFSVSFFLFSCGDDEPKDDIATVVTTAATLITPTSAVSGGTVNSDGGADVTARGVCWDTIHNPTVANSKTNDGTGTGSFVSNITGLTANKIYYVRAYATNSVGTAYGIQDSFETVVTDADGNKYHTVTIGTQVWILENLKTTHYRNGVKIDSVADNTAWYNKTTGAYCYYDNNSSANAVYGKLYNWYAVNDTNNLAPAGCHVATDDDWTTLINYLGGESVAGGKLKEAGTLHWSSPNTGATNESGFTALPAGDRWDNGQFNYVGDYGLWWASTSANTANAWYRVTGYGYANAYSNNVGKKAGLSVRCVRD